MFRFRGNVEYRIVEMSHYFRPLLACSWPMFSSVSQLLLSITDIAEHRSEKATAVFETNKGNNVSY